MPKLLQNYNPNQKKAIELLNSVKISSPHIKVDDFPHHFSGGMRQRVLIAMALSCNPNLLIADEPTGNLDAERAAEILNLLESANARGTTVLIATHDRTLLDRRTARVIRLERGRLVNA